MICQQQVIKNWQVLLTFPRLSWDVNNPERMSQAIGNIPHTLLSLGRILRPLTTFYVTPMVSYEVLEDSHVPDRENWGEWPYRAVLRQYFFCKSCSEWPNKLSWMSGEPHQEPPASWSIVTPPSWRPKRDFWTKLCKQKLFLIIIGTH